MEEDEYLSGRIIFDGTEDKLTNEANSFEHDKGGNALDWKSTRDASSHVQSDEAKKHFDVDISRYGKNLQQRRRL